MKPASLLHIFLFLLTPYSSLPQEYSYTHYDVADGLAGSTVYCITQDRDGFLWASTETGVSRFDGTHFKNFTTSDGLPDIEELQLFGDSRGRVWMAPFRKSVCYYHRGRIHNQENDSLLRSIHLKGNIQNFIEDSAGNILIQELSAVHVVTVDGRVRSYDWIGDQPILESVAVGVDSVGHFMVQAGDRIAELTDQGFRSNRKITFVLVHPNHLALSASYAVYRLGPTFVLRSLRTGKAQALPFKDLLSRTVSVSILADSLLYISQLSGCIEYNLHTGKYQRYLPGKVVSRAFRDRDGNLWFSTTGLGIFRLGSDEFRTKVIPMGDVAQTSVHSITKVDRELWLGNDRHQIYILPISSLAITGRLCLNGDSRNRILFTDTLDRKMAIYGGDNTLGTCSRLKLDTPAEYPMGVKSICKKNERQLLIATGRGVYVYEISLRRIVDTLWRERSTVVYSYRDTIYVGTLNGLYRLDGKGSVEYLGDRIPFLRERISAITRSEDGIVWIGSYGEGIVGWRHDSVVAFINKTNGLTSDICRNLYISHHTLWVGTDQGLNRIDVGRPGYPITHYGFNDGLGSNIVNVVMQDDSMVYVGTPAGLSYFNQSRPVTREGCGLYLLSVQNGGKDRIADTADLIVPFADPNIQFGFVGISYRSVGDITYRYRMIGLDSVWRTTRQTLLEYPVLPAGKYEFQLLAINKFGIGSTLLRQPFEVVAPFWLAKWFEVLLVVFFALGTWALATWWVRTIRRRQREREQLNRKMMEVERMALQAQMNPHFIFNCLTSVQQYIVDQDILSANKYITGLAKLIRLTLHHSSLAFIRLKEEIDYLSAYLALEKLRFKEKMEYSIEVDPQVLQSSCYLPPMLIQPYVENSIRHGLRHRKGGRGYIWLQISQEHKAGRRLLTVTVEDNGIGREQSASYKTVEHIEYQSKGMTMTADRIRMINAAYGGDIRVEVFDLEDRIGQPSGTRVVMQFTVFDHLPISQKESL